MCYVPFRKSIYIISFFAILLAVQTTDANKSLTTLVVKHYNDLLGSQTSELGRDEFTFSYVGGLFCIHLGTMYADFQEKIFAEISGKKFQTLGIT